MSSKSNNANKPKVDHTYRHLSRYLQKGGEVVKHKKSGSNFPAKLHRMLSEHEFSRIILWMPHGRAFKIRNKDLLTLRAVPEYFGQTKFESFTRQLSGWGFKRLYRHGPDCGCYYHECFLRGLPRLTALMRRVPSNQGKFAPFPEAEPDFYLISELYPVPPPDIDALSNLHYAAVTQPAPIADFHDSLMPVVHSYPPQNPGYVTSMVSTFMPNLQSGEMTNWSNNIMAPNQLYQLEANISAAEAMQSSAIESNSSLKMPASRQVGALSHIMSASRSTPNIQAHDWTNHGAQNTILQNSFNNIIAQDSALRSAAASVPASNAARASILMPTQGAPAIMRAQSNDAMMPLVAQANFSELSTGASGTEFERLSSSMPYVHSHYMNSYGTPGNVAELVREGLAPATRKRASSDTDQQVLAASRSTTSSDACAVMKALASYQAPGASSPTKRHVLDSTTAAPAPTSSTAPVPEAWSYLNNQAPPLKFSPSDAQRPPTLRGINEAYNPMRQPTQNNASMPAMFPADPISAPTMMNHPTSFQHSSSSELTPYTRLLAYSSGSTEYTSTEAATPNESLHQFQNADSELEPSQQEQQEDTNPSAQGQEQEDGSGQESLGGENNASFYDDMNSLLDRL